MMSLASQGVSVSYDVRLEYFEVSDTVAHSLNCAAGMKKVQQTK